MTTLRVEALPNVAHGDNVPQIESHGETHNDAATDPIPDLQNARLRLTTAEAAIVTETGARIAADAAEATARAAADSAEATTRAAADTALGGRVTVLEGLELARAYVVTGQQLTSNSTTFQNVTNMRLPLAVNQAWQFVLHLTYLSTVTADFKFQFTVPAGAVLNFSTLSIVQGGVQNFIGSAGAATSFMADGTASNVTIVIMGTVISGATPGDLQLQAAQNTATAEITDFVVTGTNLVATQVH